MELSAVILAGGRSRRMGRDKALLPFGEETFIEHLLEELSGEACKGGHRIGEVFLSAAHRKDYAIPGLLTVTDERDGIGPIEGIRRSLICCRFDSLFVCAVDMPFVKRETVFELAGRIGPDEDACLYRLAGRVHPACGLYRRRVLPVIEKMISEGNYRLADLAEAVHTRYADIEEDSPLAGTLANINTPQEYDRLIRPGRFVT